MKICNGCGTKYDDSESYCHKCDFSLKNDNYRSEPNKLDRQIVFNARGLVARTHSVVLVLSLVVVAFLLKDILLDGEVESKTIIPMVLALLNSALNGAAIYLLKTKEKSLGLSKILGFVYVLFVPIGTVFGLIILFQLSKKQWGYLET